MHRFQKDWTSRTIDLENIDYLRHPKTLEELFDIDSDKFEVFNFQRALNIEAINNETKVLDRKAHMFWEFPDVDQQICDFVDAICMSGDARKKISMTGDTKDAKNFYAAKKHEAEENIKWELSFVDSLFMMYRLRKKIMKAKAESIAFDNIRLYSHNFCDFVFYKSINFRSSYL